MHAYFKDIKMYNTSLDSKRYETEFCGNTNRNYSDIGQQDPSYSNLGPFLSNSQLNDEVHIKWNQVSDIFKPRSCKISIYRSLNFRNKVLANSKPTVLSHETDFHYFG